MPTYLLTCPCGNDLPVEVAQAGDSLTCECGENITIPNLRDVKMLPLAPDQQPVAASSWNRVNGILFFIAVISISSGVLGAGFSFIRGSQIVVDDTTEETTQYGDVVIDQMPPLESIEVFKMIRANGLGKQQQVEFLIAQEQQNQYYSYGYLAIVIAVLGCLLTGGTMIANRRRNA
ncbi:MAG: hypothetical protein VX738_12560 [Planctomycetota bacterium]|nr:hypothetical protein [Planctomycetota bacterium]